MLETELIITAPHCAATRLLGATVVADHELLVRPDRVGLCATDAELFDGSLIYLRQGRASFPIRPGHEWTGTVEAIGDGVTGFAIGDRVVGETSVGCGVCETCRAGAYHQCPDRTETGILNRSGALATIMTFPAASAFVVPSSIEPDDAVFVEPLAVAYRSLQSCGIRDSESLLVIGAGTIGTLIMLAARAMGVATIRFLERGPAATARAEGLGFSRAEPSDRFEVVMESAGSPDAISVAVERCASGGVVGLLGLTGVPYVELPTDEIVVRDIRIQGSLGSPGVWPAVIELVAAGLTPSALIGERIGLQDVPEALRSPSRHAFGKLIVLPQEGRA